MIYSHFISEKFQSFIILSLKYFQFEPPNYVSLPTYVDHEAPKICKEEPAIPFVPCPPLFLVPIWVPPSDVVKDGKSENRIVDPSIKPPPISHDLDPIDKSLEWFINYTEQPLPSTSRDSLFHDLLDQSS